MKKKVIVFCIFLSLGIFTVVNDSKYDLSSIDVIIEHFDENGKSSMVTRNILYGEIKSGGYRIFEWISLDCFNCKTRKYSIDF